MNRSPLKIIDGRMSRLTAACSIARASGREHADHFTEELEQLAMIKSELAKIENKATKKSPGVESLRREMELAARKIAETRFNDPEREDILNMFTRLAMLADSLDRLEK